MNSTVWYHVCDLDAIVPGTGVCALIAGQQIALFRPAEFGEVTLSPDGQLSTGVLAAGAGVALASHGLKAGTRALLNTSPEPASNWVASVAEDGLVIGGLALAVAHPWLALVFVLGTSILGALAVWLVWRMLWRGIKRLFTPSGNGQADGASRHSLPPAP